MIPLLSENAIKIAESYLNRELTKKEIVDSLINKDAINFIENNKLRNLIIKSLSENEARNLIDNKLGLEKLGLKKEDYWTFLQEYIPNTLTEWAEFLGLKDEYSAANQSSQKTVDTLYSQPSYSLYPYQRDIVRKVNTLISDPEKDRLLIHLPTGAGKTRTAMSIASAHLSNREDGLVLWLADTEELCAQATIEFHKSWSALGNRGVSVYSYYSDSNKTLSSVESGFISAGLQRLNSRRNGSEKAYFQKLLDKVSLIIFDEAHKAIAKTYKETVNELLNNGREKFLIGLSATPGRKFSLDDETEDRQLSKFFSENKITMAVEGYRSPIQYLIDERYLAEPQYLPIDYEGSTNLEFTTKQVKEELNQLLKNLSTVESRNSAIIKQAILEYENEASIIIFACNVEHAIALSETLNCLGYPSASVTSSEDTVQSRRFKIQQFKHRKLRILINFGILTTGFDAPCTNVAIIARPTMSLVLYSQMAGRAMRGKKSGGNESCKIYTVLDNIPEFTSLCKAFGHWNDNWNEVE
ncbi:DEAD/DEAH box helicase [Parashewanella tropica]|uniref:DEAD/DEAH box helicase n=1 Tax=Parashewanella tropica TaxID=2547970 RepID=UPI0014781F9F|nr:DEAD/DEAH box helicase [Parashewanella tropica]